MKKIILFGSGTLGYEALKGIGNESIACFCDNNPILIGKTKYGKEVIAANMIDKENAVVIICVTGDKRYSIANQLEDLGIHRYWFYDMIERDLLNKSEEEIFEFLFNQEEQVKYQCQFYRNKVKKLEQQVNYFKTHVDIRNMQPAKGDLRIRQIGEVECAVEFFECISELDIHPFLYAGNLLGYVRHNGFIPWDDDIDFGLIRKEYEKLKMYCRTNFGEKGEFVSTRDGEEVTYTIWLYHNMIQIGDGKCNVDIFPFDYYKEDYSFVEYRETAKKVKEVCATMSSETEKIEYVENIIKNNSNIVENSSCVFMGFDNPDSYMTYERGYMMPSDVLFPLKKATFEGKEFWIPNQEEEFVKYLYKDIWAFPNDVGLTPHLETS